jgi:GDP-L-fucose synthase
MAKLKIFVAGHKGMVGSAIIRLLKNQDTEIITKEKTELDLLNQVSVQNFFENEILP